MDGESYKLILRSADTTSPLTLHNVRTCNSTQMILSIFYILT